ncbi:hypothetical protein JVU11DRAFT_1800 [Chiua virens]|nr:hypothetical protein JVU11DRAFT_1800 [Chiua virens]
MALKDVDLIVAVGSELRMTSLWEAKLGRETGKSYKVLHVPNIDFPIHQLALNPSGKLLAVAGAYQVAVVVLPRAGYTKLVSSSVDCKAVQVGQFYHGTTSSVPIAKVDWHPWGEAGSTLMVMTVDGKLRQYDISVDSEEPQQVLSFVPEKKSKSFLAQDPAEREVTSFTLGKGRADWGPLTVYALTRSGDIYAICPYMPCNAYRLPWLRTYASSEHYQKPARETGTVPPSTFSVCIRRAAKEAMQRTLLTWLLRMMGRKIAKGRQRDSESLLSLIRMGKQMFTWMLRKLKLDGRVNRKEDNELPMFAVYETIDLGLVSMLQTPSSSTEPLLDLLQANHPVILPDPIHDDTIYIYHAFGVHSLEFGELLDSLATALRADDDDGAGLSCMLEKEVGTRVSTILNTFSVQRRYSNPITALCVPNDVYLSYSILTLTSAFRIASFPLNLRTVISQKETHSSSESSILAITLPTSTEQSAPAPIAPDGLLVPMDGPPAYVSLLGTEPFVPPAILTRSNSLPRLSSGTTARELMLTPDTLRFLGSQVASMTTHMREVLLANKTAEARLDLQKVEFARTQGTCGEMLDRIESLKRRVRDIQGAKEEGVVGRMQRMKATHKELMRRADRMLQLSESETKWFEELRRMKAEVIGAGKFDEASLKARTTLLKREYDRIMPSLSDIVTKEEERKKQVSDNSQSLGVSQAFELGERSSIEYENKDRRVGEGYCKDGVADANISSVDHPRSRRRKIMMYSILVLLRGLSQCGISDLDSDIRVISGDALKDASRMFKTTTETQSEKKDSTPLPGLFGVKPPATIPSTTLGASSLPPAKDADKPKDVTPVTTAIIVPPPSVLRGKTIEEIVNKWTADLDSHVREFNKFAGEVAVWDRALMENGNNLAAIYSHVLAVEREQTDIEQAHDHIEQQQKDLLATLDAYERSVGEVLGGQGGSLRALDTGPADTERDKNYVLATELHSHLDDLSGSLTQMIDSVNALSLTSSVNGPSHGNEDPMVQISQILSSHLESLQWIDGAGTRSRRQGERGGEKSARRRRERPHVGQQHNSQTTGFRLVSITAYESSTPRVRVATV